MKYASPGNAIQGIHMSHNRVTDKGCKRLIDAGCKCGHYPRTKMRLPLWLRLESNSIQNPANVVHSCTDPKKDYGVCLMKDGLCNRPYCNHVSSMEAF